jgi:mRNA-degrading endonuclease RelE of RelBE toxin-antitoxin system
MLHRDATKKWKILQKSHQNLLKEKKGQKSDQKSRQQGAKIKEKRSGNK